MAEQLFNFTTPFTSEGASAVDRSFGGLLSPGQYWLFLAADSRGQSLTAASGAASANFAFALDFAPASPTPEPMSLLLLGTRIAGVFGLRSRSANRAG
jgi:hypothetical protein